MDKGFCEKCGLMLATPPTCQPGIGCPHIQTCPKCKAEYSMEHVKTEYHGIETHYDECVVCQYRTQPE